MTETTAISHGYVNGACAGCGAREGSRPWAEVCPQPTVRDSGCRADPDDPEFCATHADGMFSSDGGRVCDVWSSPADVEIEGRP